MRVSQKLRLPGVSDPQARPCPAFSSLSKLPFKYFYYLLVVVTFVPGKQVFDGDSLDSLLFLRISGCQFALQTQLCFFQKKSLIFCLSSFFLNVRTNVMTTKLITCLSSNRKVLELHLLYCLWLSHFPFSVFHHIVVIQNWCKVVMLGAKIKVIIFH